MNTRALLPLMPLLMGCVIISGNNDDNADNDSTSGDGDGDQTGDGDGDQTGDGDGEPGEFCGLSEGPAEPWFTLKQFGVELEQGSDLAVECGFQGSFMIEVDPDLGGFIPDSEYVTFKVTLDVEGFNSGPDGHFATGDFDIFVGCCDEDD
jgi:hypothetical protein